MLIKGVEIPVCRWGNGNGIRISRSLLRQFSMDTGDVFIMDVYEDKIILTPKRIQKRLTLKELFKDYSGPNHAELCKEETLFWDNIEPSGKEVF